MKHSRIYTSLSAFVLLAFLITPSADATAIQTLASFNGSNGANPHSGLTAVNGTLYGTTVNGGQTNEGTLFSYNSADGLQAQANFSGRFRDPIGGHPYAGLTAVDGTIYGTTVNGGPGLMSLGTLFSYSSTGGLQTLAGFSYNGPNGAHPYAGLTAVNDTLYGTAAYGGGENYGALFSYSSADGLQTLASFNYTINRKIGTHPYAGLTVVNGTLYGTTISGSLTGDGTLFSYNPVEGLQTLVSFNRSTGTTPYAGLTAVNGTLYGTTYQAGGLTTGGTLFSYNSLNGLRILARFNGNNGYSPHAPLTAVNGTLYGTTVNGGTAHDGTLFSYNSADGLQTLASFSGKNGAHPYAGLTAVNGTLYGTTAYGGTVNDGTLFAYDLSSSTAVPEPGALLMLMIGLSLISGLTWHRRRSGAGIRLTNDHL